MIYKIIFSIAIFILNFWIIKDEILNYSRKIKILLLIFSLLWFLTFFMEMRGTIFFIMVTMLIFKFSSKIYVNTIDEMDLYCENIYFVVSFLFTFKVYPFIFLNLIPAATKNVEKHTFLINSHSHPQSGESLGWRRGA